VFVDGRENHGHDLQRQPLVVPGQGENEVPRLGQVDRVLDLQVHERKTLEKREKGVNSGKRFVLGEKN